MTSRRAFLIGIGSALAAPAIVRAESLMKIVVPKREIITPELAAWLEATGIGSHPAFLRMMWEAAKYLPEHPILGADWPSRTIKAPPGGFKIVRG